MKNRILWKFFLACCLLGWRSTTWSQTGVPSSFDDVAPPRSIDVRDYVTPDGEPGPTDFVELEQEPVPLNLNEMKAMIGYPLYAKDYEIQGKVIIRVLVSEEGKYLKHVLLISPHESLTNGIASKIDQLRCSPGILDGKPVKAWLTIPFAFSLLDSDAPSKASKGQFYSLKAALAYPDPTHVTELDLSRKSLETVPLEVLKFPNLRHLDLRDNLLKEIPVDLQGLQQLRTLSLSYNRLRSLPVEVLEMPNLNTIDVVQNDFPIGERHQLEKKHGDKLFPKDAKGKVIW